MELIRQDASNIKYIKKPTIEAQMKAVETDYELLTEIKSPRRSVIVAAIELCNDLKFMERIRIRFRSLKSKKIQELLERKITVLEVLGS